jgi:hypothetical protein
MEAAEAKTRKILTIDDIFEVKDTRFLEIEVPEWGGSIRVAALSAGDMIDFVESNSGPAQKTAGIRLIILSLVDEQGNRIGKPEMIERFRKRDTRAMNRVVDALMELNDMNLSEKAIKKMLGVEKNVSSGVENGASPTA